LLEQFAALDDFDVVSALKIWTQFEDRILSFLSSSILNRKLFRLEFSDTPFDESYVKQLQRDIMEWNQCTTAELPYLFIQGKESNSAYSKFKDEIKILHKDGSVNPISDSMDLHIPSEAMTKYYLCYPKMKTPLHN
jgi:hypothetical protein